MIKNGALIRVKDSFDDYLTGGENEAWSGAAIKHNSETWTNVDASTNVGLNSGDVGLVVDNMPNYVSFFAEKSSMGKPAIGWLVVLSKLEFYFVHDTNVEVYHEEQTEGTG